MITRNAFCAFIIAVLMTITSIAIAAPYIPLRVELSAVSGIELGQTTEVNCTIYADEDTTNVVAEISVPPDWQFGNGLEIIFGQPTWTGNLNAGGSATFTVTIQAIQTGEWEVEAKVSGEIQSSGTNGVDIVENYADSLWFIVTADSGEVKSMVEFMWDEVTTEEIPTFDVYDASIPIGPIVPTVHPSQPIEAVPPDNLEDYDDESGSLSGQGTSPTITVKGWVYYKDRDDFKRPCAAATVAVFDADTFPDLDDYLGSVLVDDNGYFELSDILNNDISGGRDIYIKVMTANNMWAVEGIHPEVGFISIDMTPSYKWRSSTHSDVQDGATVYIGGTTPDTGWIIPDSDRDAMRVFQDIRAASSFACLNGHHPFDDDAEFRLGERYLTCYWPSPWIVRTATGGVSMYLPYSYKFLTDIIPPFNVLSPLIDDTNVIFSVRGNPADTIYHEYGHYMMDAAYGNQWPTIGNFWEQVIGGHRFFIPNNPIKAWSEGWADFVAAAVREYVSANPVGKYRNWDIEGLFETSTQDKWKSTEAYIAAGLYDLYDSMTHPLEYDSDNLGLGFYSIWDIIWDDSLDDVDEFWDAWQARGDFLEECWTIFAFNGIRLSWGVTTPQVTVTWSIDSLPKDPYFITKDIVVDPEFRLNIVGYPSMVTILFSDQDQENRGIDESRIEFIVYGKLNAEGAKFESWLSNPAPGSWYGITLKPGSEYYFSACTVKDSQRGIKLLSDAPNQFIHNCTITNNDYGLWCQEYSKPIVVLSDIGDNNYGVYISHNAQPNLGNLDNTSTEDDGDNTFSGNSSYDIANYTSNVIYAQGNDFEISDPVEIDNNRIYDDGENPDSGMVVFQSMILKAGWNMISFPGTLVDSDPSSFLAIEGIQQILELNVATQEYQIPTILSLGVGYWVLVETDTSLSLDMAPALSYSRFESENGWWLTGSVMGRVNVLDIVDDPEGSLIPTNTFWYNPQAGHYEVVEYLDAWKGYWVILREPNTTLTVSTVPAAPPLAGGQQPNPWSAKSSLTITQDEGKTQSVFFGVHPQGTAGFEPTLDKPLPPPRPVVKGEIPPLDFYIEAADEKIKRLSESIQGDGKEEKRWMLKANSQDSDFVLSWDVSQLGEKMITIQNEEDVIDMKETPSQRFPSGNYTFLLVMTEPKEKPADALGANFPNPFNPDTWIPYQLSSPTQVVINIYNVHGQLIRTLDLGRKDAGYYTTKAHAGHWDGRNTQGERVSSGVYFYTIKAGNFVATKKLAIVK